MEIEQLLVKECFKGIFDRDVDDLVCQNHAATLASGLPLSTYIKNMLGSAEYISRQGKNTEFTSFTPVCTDLGDRRLWLDLSDLYVSRICLNGNYEPQETSFIRANLSAGDVFIDIGANIGWFSTLAASLVGPTGHVHAFEPRDQTRSLLNRSILDNGYSSYVTVYGYPLAAERTETRLVWLGHGNNPGGTRLARNEDDNFENMSEQTVTTIPLDDVEIAGRVSLVKLDVEGAEGIVLKGAKTFLAKHRPIILTEIFEDALVHVSGMTLDDYIELIGQIGYSIHELDGHSIGKVLDEAALRTDYPFNIILVPNETAA